MHLFNSCRLITAFCCAILLLPAQAPPDSSPRAASRPRPARRALAGEPGAPRLAIIALDEIAGRLAPLATTLAAGEGFEVLPEAEAGAADFTILLRSSAGADPAVVYSPLARAAAGELQRAWPGARAAVCELCFDSHSAAIAVDLGGASGSATGQMQAALALRDTLRTISDRGPRTAVKAEMISPAPGATLPGASVTFQWSAGSGAASYWLMAGSWPGGNTLYSADQGLLTSAPVSGLPADGRTIYVRLWSYVDNQWLFNDYQYQAAGGATPVKARITSPIAGSTLPGSTVTFEWDAGAGAARYYLFAGLWQGGNTLFSQDMNTSLQARVSGLPTDGSTIHVRLWSLIDGVWQFDDSAFTAAGSVTPAKAALTSPVPSTTLPATSVTFEWSPGQGVTRYYLFVGRWQGGNTLFSRDMGTGLSAVVSNLPDDSSPVWVRLWSFIAGQWQFNDYSFTSAGAAPAVQKAQMISPLAGSTLAGSSAVFTWTTGSRVQRYWLFVGTSLGNNNLHGSDQGTTTSAAVSNLPVNGQVIYVRLWSYIDGAWQFNDNSYRAASQ